jgi:hypothetical protein
MSKHTPGPWTVEPWAEDGGFGIKSPHGLWFANVYPVPSHPAEANARLIAAAPEMYDFIRKVSIDCENDRERCEFGSGPRCDFHDLDNHAEAARGLLAKLEPAS